MTDAAVSAIVVSFQTGPRLKECLYALAGDPEIGEIILVDNGNPPDMEAWQDKFAAARDGVVIVRGHGNIGFGAGVNLGLKTAAGPDILVLNPDAVLRRNSIAGLQSVAETCAEPWIIGGRLFDLYGREERGPRRKELTLWRAATSLIGWNTWTLERTPSPDEPIDIPVISGGFFLTSKASMAQLDGFDEGYFLHVEDVDLCHRCRAAGGRVMYDPRAGALHYGSTSDAPSATVARHKGDSLARYFKTYARGGFERALVFLAMPVMRLGLALSRR
ncbi:MAG: glycosyltransferase family 2 protein [Pseudomonadota bacterium]